MTAEIAAYSSSEIANSNERIVTTGRIGVIDIGSNSVRMVVYDALARLPVPVFNERVTCRLGSGLGQHGTLNPEGVELALTALTRFTNLAREMNVERFELLGTAAVRDATDGPEFVAEIHRRFGASVQVLSGEAEASLAALGILAGSPAADGLLGDMGGGSLDLVGLDEGQFGESKTLPLGHLRIREDSGRKISAAKKIIDQKIESVEWLNDYKDRPLHVVGGSWRALARVSIEQSDYPLKVLDNYTLPTQQAEDLTRLISGLSPASLEKLAGVARRRADTLPYSALVLLRLIEIVRPSHVIFSGYSMREGKLFDLLPPDLKIQDPLISACEGFARRSGRFSIHGDETMAWMAPLFGDQPEHDLRLCLAASLLSDIGWTEHPDYRALHAFTRVLRLPIAGVSHRDRVFLALAVFVRYNGGRKQFEVNQVRVLLEEELQRRAAILGLALRLAHVLSGGVGGLLSRTQLVLKGKKLTLHLSPNQELFMSAAVERLFGSLADTIGVKAQIK